MICQIGIGRWKSELRSPPDGEMGGLDPTPPRSRGFDRNPPSWVPPSRVPECRTPTPKPELRWETLEKTLVSWDLTSGQFAQGNCSIVNTTSEDLMAAISSFLMCSTIPQNMVVPPDTRHCCTALGGCDRHNSRRLERSTVESAGSFTRGILLEEHICAVETFGSTSDDVAVREHSPDPRVSAVSSCVMEPYTSWNMFEPFDNTTSAYTFGWMWTSHSLSLLKDKEQGHAYQRKPRPEAELPRSLRHLVPAQRKCSLCQKLKRRSTVSH